MRRYIEYLLKWWKSRVRAIGKETYIRLYPNPGFRIFFKKMRREIRWNPFYGWHAGRVKR